MKLTRRWMVLLGLLAASAGLVLFSPPPKQVEVVAAAERPATRNAANTDARLPTPVSIPTQMILELRPRGAATSSADVFASHNWSPPPPPPPPKPAVPAKPLPPPMPFVFLGKKQEDGKWEVFLGRQDQTFIVKQEDVIDRNYRVESIQPPTLTLVYLPLNEKQTVAIGGLE